MNGHIGDDAALYALGALDGQERAAIDAHARDCAACAQALGAAADSVTALASMEQRRDVPPALDARMRRAETMRAPAHWRAWSAIAAALLLALLPALYFAGQNSAMQRTLGIENAAMHRLALLPHRTASFSGADARVMYAGDGSWYCIVVNGTAPMHVMWPHDGTQTDLGTTGGDGVLYLPQSHRMDHLMLVRDGSVVAKASLAF